MKRIKQFSLFLFLLLLISGCSRKTGQTILLKNYPVNDLDGIITQTGIAFDQEVSEDGKGSLKITAIEPTIINLYETGDIDVENTRLSYEAKIRTENIKGKVFLEMWCHFEGQGEYFSRNLQSFLTGTNDWSSRETFFFLKKGENPDNIKLNLVIEGTGTAWIDDIRLLKAPL
ncbi:MAG TPA: hypothetical protein ENL20_02095 [Candidatus Cloacimonetes bacterium]|nr:hypothetical protein [Candidatus Cloacimonadota bacterium]